MFAGQKIRSDLKNNSNPFELRSFVSTSIFLVFCDQGFGSHCVRATTDIASLARSEFNNWRRVPEYFRASWAIEGCDSPRSAIPASLRGGCVHCSRPNALYQRRRAEVESLLDGPLGFPSLGLILSKKFVRVWFQTVKVILSQSNRWECLR